MLLFALRVALKILFIVICIVLLTGGLLVATLNATNLLAKADTIPTTMVLPTTFVIILFSMTLLAPVFEWWFKIWRNADRRLQILFRKE